MKWSEQANRNPRRFLKGAAAFCVLILFTLILYVNKSEAGWIRTDGEKVALEFIDTLQKRDLKSIKRFLDPRLLAEEHRAGLENAVKVFPEGSIKEITRLNVQVNYDFGGEGRREELQFYVELYRTALLMDVVLQKKDGKFLINGFHFNEAPMGLMEQFPFSMVSWVQPKNVFMAVAVLDVLLMIVALIFWSIRPLKMKLLWLPVIFAGFMEASAQWVDDGPWNFNLLALKIPPVWIDAGGQDPWSIVVSFPLGAIVVVILAVTAKPEEEVLTVPPRRSMPVRTQVRPPARPRTQNQPANVGK